MASLEPFRWKATGFYHKTDGMWLQEWSTEDGRRTHVEIGLYLMEVLPRTGGSHCKQAKHGCGPETQLERSLPAWM